ncbi:MAG: type IV toxin-antitoxin system AbiEi family antitoxin [Actinomycetota bacterium]
MLTEKELIYQIKNRVLVILNNIKFIKVIKTQEKVSFKTLGQIDLLIEVQTKINKKYSLIFEIKTNGQPRFARMAVGKLKEIVSQNKKYYGVFASSYISRETMKICLNNNMGSIDIGGNCFFNFDNVYVNIEGKPNPFPSKNPLKTLFYPKSSRVIRVLLSNPKKAWFIKDLSEEAGVSIGQTFKVKEKLLEEEYIKESQEYELKKFILQKPEALLNDWIKNYSYKKNIIKNYYSLDNVKTIEDKIVDYCKLKNIKYAFTLTSGASFVAPFLRYNKVFFYTNGNIEKIVKDLNFKEVSTGANISILKPYDEGIFYKLQQINKAVIVSNIQLYLDLKSFKERGEEAAEFLYEQRIVKNW